MSGEQTCKACGYEAAFDGPTHAYMSFSPACWARYGEILAREFSDAGYFKKHRLLVDACCGQHSVGTDRRVRQSLHIHMAGLMLYFEDNAAESVIVNFLRKAARIKEFAPLEMPKENNKVTVSEIFTAEDAVEHCAAVEKYARKVFEVWAVHHDVFRGLISEVLT